MKNILKLLFIINLAVPPVINAQSPIQNGEWQLNGGFGFSGWGLPVYIGLDYGIHPNISMGGEFSFRNYRNNVNSRYYDHSILGFLVNGNYHFNQLMGIPDPWDFYAGLNVGFYSWTSDDEYPRSGSSGLGLGLQVGGRYYFSEKFGINLELGGGNTVSGGKFGITLKL